MIKKEYKRAVDGGIIEIPLWNNFGYAYAKRIDGTKHPELEGLIDLIRVFNYWAKKPLENLSLLASKPILNTYLVAGLPPTITKKQWKVIGKAAILSEDLAPVLLKRRFDDDDPWFLTENGHKKMALPADRSWEDYEQYAYQGTGNIEIRLTLKILELEGLDPKDHIDVTDQRIKWMIK